MARLLQAQDDGLNNNEADRCDDQKLDDVTDDAGVGNVGVEVLG